MPGRKKPASAKQHKAKLQHQRAIKRGDAEPDPPKDHRPRKPSARPQDPSATASASALSTPEHLKAQQIIASARRLQSSFVKLSPALLERSKVLADRVILERPIRYDAAIWKLTSGRMEDEREEAIRKEMSCMRRPKWKYEQTKNEVEKNEEGVYAKWLDKMDGLVQSWVDAADEARRAGLQLEDGDRDPELPPKEDEGMPPSPTIFERNLEVWRQLWRVTELSQILLILLDSRCPLLHFPPSLQTYLSSPSYKLILVLTKVDISGPERAEAWSAYLTAKFPGVQVVMVESYIPKATVADFDNDGEVNLTKGRRRRYEPHIPHTFKERLVDALKTAHRQLLEPPERVRQDPEKLARWRPKVKREVNWDALLTAGASSHVSRPTKDAPQNSEGGQEDEEPEYLTVGLLGQPNVGKSSLLNALFGTIKVRASKTPGKTKHFQTLFWTPDIRLVDCPGLVMPDLIPLEMQVLSGILPIARMPAIPLCISYSSLLLPLEQIFNLSSHHPFVKSPPVQDKRTWRQGMRKGSATDGGGGGGVGGMEEGMKEKKEGKDPKWTAMDIMTAYADRKGWVTAKAGRPDVNRAGNAMLRALAEGKIPWAFWPPGTDSATLSTVGEGNGIWIPDPTGEEHEIDDDESDEDQDHDGELDVDSDEDGEEGADEEESEGQEDGDEDGEEEEPVIVVAKKGGGMFGALALDDDAEEEEEEGEDEEA